MKHVLVEMEGNAQNTETKLSYVLVHLLTKASCVNKKVSSNPFILKGTAWSKVIYVFILEQSIKILTVFFFFQFDHVTVDRAKMEEIVLMMG